MELATTFKCLENHLGRIIERGIKHNLIILSIYLRQINNQVPVLLTGVLGLQNITVQDRTTQNRAEQYMTNFNSIE